METVHPQHINQSAQARTSLSFDTKPYILGLTLLLYGAFGSPTPEQFNYAEIAIGACLLILSISTLYNSHSGNRGLGFVVYGTIAGLIIGATHHNPQNWIIRDVIAFQFLALPFWLGQEHDNHHNNRHDNQGVRDILLYGCLFIGFSFALRFLYATPLTAILTGREVHINQSYLYLANSPLVLFAALYSAYRSYRCYSHTYFIRTVFWVATMAIPIFAMWVMQQRASLGFCAIYTVLLILAALKNRVIISTCLIIGIATILYTYADTLAFFIEPLINKHNAVGLNMRNEEWNAVLSLIGESPLRALFGYGWGGWFSSPAVEYMQVNFTHNLFSTYLLKTGLIGTVFLIGFLHQILRQSWQAHKDNILLYLTIFMPFFIACILYANFKSLGFGLLLLLFITPLHRCEPYKSK